MTWSEIGGSIFVYRKECWDLVVEGGVRDSQ